MEKFLFIDTETTGLPVTSSEPPINLTNWNCRLVSIAYILTENNCIIDKGYYIIKPAGFIIPISATKIHGITTAMALEKGVEIKKVLDLLLELITIHKPYIVGHNVEFDINIIDSEFFRAYKKCPLNLCRRFCTLITSTKYCRLPNNKYPKLSELYYSLFGENFENTHNALADVEATYKCFKTLKECNIPTLESSKPRLFAGNYRDYGKSFTFLIEYNILETDGVFFNQTLADIVWVLNLFCNKDFKCSQLALIREEETYLDRIDLHISFAFSNLCNIKAYDNITKDILLGYTNFKHVELLPDIELPNIQTVSFVNFHKPEKLIYIMLFLKAILMKEEYKEELYSKDMVTGILNNYLKKYKYLEVNSINDFLKKPMVMTKPDNQIDSVLIKDGFGDNKNYISIILWVVIIFWALILIGTCI